MSKRRDKGDGTIRKRNDGLWEGRYRDSVGRVHSVYGKTKTEVNNKLKNAMYAQSISTFENVAGDVEFDVWIQHYYELKGMGVKKRSLNQIRMAYENHIRPILGKKQMCKLVPNDILAVVNSVKDKGLSNNSINNILTHFRTMINCAVQERVIPYNPLFPILVEKKAKIPRRDLSPEEVNIILNAAKEMSEKLYLMIYILITTGIRVGELCGLKWQDMGDGFSSIFVNESRTDNIFESTTKSEASVRSIPICNELSTMLSEYYQTHNNKEYGGYIFISRIHKPYTDQSVDKQIRVLRERIYKDLNIDLRFLTPHYFRHTFVTVGLNNGVELHDMQRLAGHKKNRNNNGIFSSRPAKEENCNQYYSIGSFVETQR